jgi:hypothetical protein
MSRATGFDRRDTTTANQQGSNQDADKIIWQDADWQDADNQFNWMFNWMETPDSITKHIRCLNNNTI